MEKQAFISQTRALIAESELDKALQLMQNFFQSDAKYKTLLRETVEITAQYNKARKDEEKGIVSFENAKLVYNQANNAALNVLDYLSADELNPAELAPPPSKMKQLFESNRLTILIGLPTLLIGVTVLLLVLKVNNNNDGTNGGTVIATDSTVAFCEFQFNEDKDASNNILIMPFYRLDENVGKEVVEDLIYSRLEEFCNENGLKVELGFCDKFKPDRPLVFKRAEQIGMDNKARMVIWGIAGKGNNNNEITTRFKLVGTQDSMQISRLKWQGEKQVDTVKALSGIILEGALTADIEEVLLLMLAVYAHESGNPEAAIAALQGFQTADSAAHLLKNMVLWEDYLATGQNAKATATLDTLLAKNPGYVPALNNRSIIKMGTGDYIGAIADLSVAIEKRPDDANLLNARGWAYFKSEYHKESKDDFDRVVAIDPARRKEVDAIRKNNDRQIVSVKKEIAAKRYDQNPPENVTKEEAIAAVEANQKLGEYDKASQWLKKGLEISKNDPKLIAGEIEILLRKKDKKGALQALNKAKRAGVDPKEIARHSREVALFIRKRAELEE